MRPLPLKNLALVVLLTSVAAAAVAGVERELSTPRQLHGERYVRAAQCQRCHPDHAASFGRTFHRTMTQTADARSVRGDFATASLDYFGVRAHFTRSPHGAFQIDYQVADQPAQHFDVVMTVGSRRYQQYIARRGKELVRLPVAYHLEERRWFHMNGAFLTPDPSSQPLTQGDYERHVTRWNDNCVFCHNVAPSPGMHGAGAHTHFETEVAELGVACEACHGPGAAHERANVNPLRRYLLHASDRPDLSIVNPRRLSQERSLDVCGRCHGQRITDDVERFLRQGDPFVPGDDLALYSAPLWRDTTLHGEAVFEARFWRDGTPRLTAYEYQGTLQSPCAKSETFTCLSCHAMHDGDPHGQLRPDRSGDALCTQCHAKLGAKAAKAQHAQHPTAALPGCVDCHMPKIVYGVLEAHRSHRIEIPQVARHTEFDRPDACTQCHVDRTVVWAAEQQRKMWPALAQRSAMPPRDVENAWPETERKLFAGDPIQRVLAAAALQRRAPEAQRPQRLARLLEAMELDPYPAVRHVALRAARSHMTDPALDTFVPEQPLAERKAQLSSLRARFPLGYQDARTTEQLRGEASARAIDIGE
jgi:predicted CXXCH cytochrome family protein